MNLKGNWNEIKGKLKQKYGQLTDDDLVFAHPETGRPLDRSRVRKRFQRACRMLERPRHPGLAGVAAACGYYDQAHLTREWNELAGCTPTLWMAEELPSVQDAGAGPDAGCAA